MNYHIKYIPEKKKKTCHCSLRVSSHSLSLFVFKYIVASWIFNILFNVRPLKQSQPYNCGGLSVKLKTLWPFTEFSGRINSHVFGSCLCREPCVILKYSFGPRIGLKSVTGPGMWHQFNLVRLRPNWKLIIQEVIKTLCTMDNWIILFV